MGACFHCEADCGHLHLFNARFRLCSHCPQNLTSGLEEGPPCVFSKKLHVFHGSQNVIYKGMFFIGEFHESQGRDRKKSRMARGMPNRYREGSSLLAPSPTEGYVLSRI